MRNSVIQERDKTQNLIAKKMGKAPNREAESYEFNRIKLTKSNSKVITPDY